MTKMNTGTEVPTYLLFPCRNIDRVAAAAVGVAAAAAARMSPRLKTGNGVVTIDTRAAQSSRRMLRPLPHPPVTLSWRQALNSDTSINDELYKFLTGNLVTSSSSYNKIVYMKIQMFWLTALSVLSRLVRLFFHRSEKYARRTMFK